MGKKRRRDEEDEAEGGSLGGLGARSWILSRLRTFGLLCLQAATVWRWGAHKSIQKHSKGTKKNNQYALEPKII